MFSTQNNFEKKKHTHTHRHKSYSQWKCELQLSPGNQEVGKLSLNT